MYLVDVIKKRKNIVTRQSEGVNLAISLINEYENRTFTFKGTKNKYIGIRKEKLLKLIQEELDSMLVLYHYTTRAKTYIDKNEVSQAEIRLIGKASTMNRFNPLDTEMVVTTETPCN